MAADPVAADPVAADPVAPEPVPAAHQPAAASAEPAAEPEADDQAARPRPGKKNTRGRRSSVPSWDEIMLGSSRERD